MSKLSAQLSIAVAFLESRDEQIGGSPSSALVIAEARAMIAELPPEDDGNADRLEELAELAAEIRAGWR